MNDVQALRVIAAIVLLQLALGAAILELEPVAVTLLLALSGIAAWPPVAADEGP